MGQWADWFKDGEIGWFTDGGRADGLMGGWGCGWTAWMMDGGPAGGEEQAVRGWAEAAEAAPAEKQGAEPGARLRGGKPGSAGARPGWVVLFCAGAPAGEGLVTPGSQGGRGMSALPALPCHLTPAPVCRALRGGVWCVGSVH